VTQTEKVTTHRYGIGKMSEEIDNATLEMMRQAAVKQHTQSTSKRKIWVTFQKEGIHKYPAALDDPKLATGGWDDVSFLGYPHRHMFHFRVSIQVWHDDREIEFIQFSRWLQRLFSEDVMTLDYKSCEMIADEMFAHIDQKYPGREVTIEVSEDNENGAVVEYNIKQ
jgi:hypothetical protein